MAFLFTLISTLIIVGFMFLNEVTFISIICFALAALIIYLKFAPSKVESGQPWGFMNDSKQFICQGVKIPLNKIKYYKFSKDYPESCQYNFVLEEKELSEPVPAYSFLRLFLKDGQIVTFKTYQGGYYKNNKLGDEFKVYRNALDFACDFHYYFFDYLPKNLQEENRKQHNKETKYRQERFSRELEWRKELVDKGATVSQIPKAKQDASVVGRAVAGGIIAGPAGAVVGAISAADKNNKNRSQK